MRHRKHQSDRERTGTLREVLENIRPGRLGLTLLYAGGMAVCGWQTVIRTGRYSRGFAFLGTLVLAVLFFRSANRLLSDRLQAALGRLLGKALRVLSYPITLVAGKIAGFLGIGRWRGWGEDERTFLWKQRRTGEERKKRLKNDQKWADQTDNCHRVRYLYTDFMIRSVRNGFLLRRQMTPDEIAQRMPLDEEEKLLFSTYDLARYAGNPEIPDETVEKLRRTIARQRESRRDHDRHA